MKVILTSNIRKLGVIGDVKVVADGYGKNFLLNKDLAIPYSEEAYKVFETKKAEIEKENANNIQKALENKAKIEKIEILVLENAGDNDKLYGSITTSRLANLINSLIKSDDIEKSNIIIKEPIKELGKFNITIELHHDVVFDKEILIARSKEEAKKLKEKKVVKTEKTKKEQDDKEETKKDSEKEVKKEAKKETKKETKKDSKKEVKEDSKE